ncbi:Sugar transferase involved in LPS biosynthesis (colanic, teichoic acid) [[Clostridium] aminophilum]|uniref:Sugar transferase involved in LPS biosynthesis (Colanic, teichoic acid) n=2 Tax=[Clostridium] aminophilum TaxID=1526 RepID=A0A1I0FK40_9FIRM|nr:Sugar transferase involved in LPS biosynthesis (colanic, teichoic acid) [[Clostridium] aminophilum]
MIYSNYVKRLLSICLSSVGLVLASPIMLITAILIRIKLGSPVIFSQERPGYKEKIFRLYKFRSMTDARDESGELLPDKERQTRFGRILRKTSIDELPGMWNILKGDMAFIGPRPLLKEYLQVYTPEQHKRHNVRPGMANISAIKGRNKLDWEERLKLDVWYAENISFLLDLKIFFQTIKVVLLREGAPDANDSTRGRLDVAVTGKKLKGE